jgi:hypothetical protein
MGTCRSARRSRVAPEATTRLSPPRKVSQLPPAPQCRLRGNRKPRKPIASPRQNSPDDDRAREALGLHEGDQPSSQRVPRRGYWSAISRALALNGGHNTRRSPFGDDDVVNSDKTRAIRCDVHDLGQNAVGLASA